MTDEIDIFREKPFFNDDNESTKPDILLIDLSDEICQELESKGFNVSNGSFGTPYYVYPSDDWDVVKGEDNLPVISEQDIVIIDLVKGFVDENEVEYFDPGEIKELHANCSEGWIDPRPQLMDRYAEKFDRIFENGGLFVVFADQRYYYRFCFGEKDGFFFELENSVSYDNWSLLSILNNLAVYEDEGTEIKIAYDNSAFKEFFKKYLSVTTYNSRFASHHIPINNFISLLNNKFNQSVGCLINANNSETSGHVLILPDMPRTPELILDLLNEVLPSLAPHLFPNVKGKWVERDEYEFNSVIRYKSQIEEIITKAKNEIESIKDLIAGERDKHSFLYGILTGTGDELVVDFKKYLEFIGFEKVVNVDNELKDGENKEEDLRICDNSPSLLLEVKGVSTKSKEEYVMQLVKYIKRRMEEWERFDIAGVLIINHQKNLPPLERDNTGVFTDKQIKDAVRDNILLITTWELFLLVRGMMKYDWDPKVIRDLFYQPGRIPEVPSNYDSIGQIGRIFKDKGAIGIEITTGELSLGQKIGYKLPNEFLEEDIKYLEIENTAVETAVKGDRIGITSKFIDKLREGLTVYKII